MEKFKLGLQTLGRPSSSEVGSFNSPGFAPDQTAVLIRRAPGRMISLQTCSKIWAVSFVVGVAVGFTLKRRVKRWVTKLLKRLKDD